MYTKELRPKYFSAIQIYDLINNKSILLSRKERESGRNTINAY